VSAYYNENDPKTAAWLRELIRQGLIADGEVDTRSIIDVRPEDLSGFAQCHFFAGIGGWSYALRLAGWPDDRECWTGSCPCQPFSSAGKGDGADDPRHLWPTWFRLIRQRLPVRVFGEQVSGPDGRAWFDAVSTDMETLQYAIGAIDLPAASVGAFHIRNRLWFVADAVPAGWPEGWPVSGYRSIAGSSGVGDVADAKGVRAERLPAKGRRPLADDPGSRQARGVADADGGQSSDRDLQRSGRHDEQSKDAPAGFWDAVEWLECSDGKRRPVEPGTFPLAHGLPARVGRLRGYGNAIVPQVAAEVIAAYMEIA
jgi:DNA (cytosine-5)-methyltransferase 1